MDLIRHALATLSYRLGKVLRDTPPEFRDFRAAPGTRTPGEILAHVGDLMDWALSQVEGRARYRASEPLAWNAEIARFFAAIERLDQHLEEHGPGGVEPERLFQGAIADALTHTGQLALLRRLAENPVRAENYYVAEIVMGRVGPHQADPKKEF